MEIIGRSIELRELEKLYSSGQPEFVAVYGRRRVGKTFLIRECFNGRFAFYHTGVSPSDFADRKHDLQMIQLLAFCTSLQQYGAEWDKLPENWFEAFDCLRIMLAKLPKGERKVVFIDELPWLDTRNSGFVSALEHFWNGWGAGEKELMLIVCGSAASWMSDNILNNIGGLYGRLTRAIYLAPFNLSECEQFFTSRGIRMSRFDQVQSYMIFGGIPYYLNCFASEKSLAQNVDEIIFAQRAPLKHEFWRLYHSIFSSGDKYIDIVRLLSSRRDGFTRKEIAEKTKYHYNGALSTMLDNLVRSDFVTTYTYYGGSARLVYYKLTDSFSSFYLHFLEGKTCPPQYFSRNLNSPEVLAWRGLAFEDVCLVHQEQIKKALGFFDVETEAGPWRSKIGNAQVDLLFVRKDNVINICEMKFTAEPFVIDKDYAAELQRKIARFIAETKSRFSIHLSLISPFGLVSNEYSGSVQSTASLDDLF